MANPFGEVVDDEKLDQMERYFGKCKSQEDRAREAMHFINEDGKNDKAGRYAQTLKDFHGAGVATLCTLYNATGDTIYYVDDRDWIGNLGRTPYPTEIGNGQWAAFIHVHPTSQATGSEASVVYRGKNKDGDQRDYLMAWSTPWGPWFKNKSYCDVDNLGGFAGKWDSVRSSLENGDYSHQVKKEGCIIETDIATGTSPFLRAIIQIPFTD